MVDIIYTPILGQSNASNMLNFSGDDDSGHTVLESSLESITGLSVSSVFESEDYEDGIDLAVGGSSVDGDNTYMPDNKIWWYPDADQPGGALLNAISHMQEQYGVLAADGEVKVAVIWGQGEHSASVIAQADDQDEMTARYKAATESIFDYIVSEMGVDVDFYVMQTGFLDSTGAINDGMSPEEIDSVNDGVVRVRDAQEDLAQLRDDVHIAVNYDDLQNAYETGEAEKQSDKWHLGYDSYEVIGARLAQYIADDLGYSGSIANPNYIEGTLLADSILGGSSDDSLIGGVGADSLDGADGNDYIIGGTGADVLHGRSGADILIGNTGDDYIYGGTGADVLLGDSGQDKLVGESGADFIIGGLGKDTLEGGSGNDFLSGDAGRDKLTGGEGADVFRIAFTSDSVRGESGNRGYDAITDFEIGVDKIDLTGLGFHDIVFGTSNTEGVLRIHYSINSERTYIRDDFGSDFEMYLEGDYTSTLTASDFYFDEADIIIDDPDDEVEEISLIGTNSNDLINAGLEDDYILGFGGDDTIDGSAGDDTINGGYAEDKLTGGAGADVFRFTSLVDSVDDNAANNNEYDRITDFEVGVDILDLTGLGFTGLDADGGSTEAGELRLSYSSGSQRTYVRSDQLDFEFYLDGNYTSTLTNDDFIFGDQLYQIVGTNSSESLIGTNFNDSIHGLSGNDNIIGGFGADFLDGGAGRDVLTGGAGADVFRFSHLGDSVRSSGSIVVAEKYPVSKVLDTYNDNIDIDKVNDVSLLKDYQFIEKDVIEGLNYSSKLDNETSYEKKISLPKMHDRITDFEIGIDKIDLSALNFIGVVVGTASEGELRLKYLSGSDRTYVRDDHGSDFEFFLDGNYIDTLTNSDFIFA